MADLICTQKLAESRGVKTFCQCFKCREKVEKDREWASVLDYYQGPQPEEPFRNNPFPKEE